MEKGLAEGKKTWTIGKELSQWIEKLFEAKVNPKAIDIRARRIKDTKELSTKVENESTPEDDSEIYLLKKIQGMGPFPLDRHCRTMLNIFLMGSKRLSANGGSQ